jgi:hypothetical protein
MCCCWCRRRTPVIAIYHNRENRKHREIVEAIREHGPPPGWRG